MSLSSLNILVVDDMAAMRKITSDILKQIGFRNIYVAENGSQALQQINHHHIDLILSDWNMPIMDGLSFLKAIRSRKNMANTPFIMITAEAESERVHDAIKNGVTDLIVKPFSRAALEKRVTDALSGARRPTPKSYIAQAPSDTAEDVVLSTPKPKFDKKMSILIVDDTPDNLMLLTDLLKDKYAIKAAKEGDTALSICQSDNPPDLVLLDIMMPGMNGYQVLRKMREHPTSELIPVIFVTALEQDKHQLKGFEVGALDYITKPINPELLKLRVKNLMRYVSQHKRVQFEYDAMLEAERLKKQVEQIIRHDLKGPIAGIMALTGQLLEDKQQSQFAHERNQLLDDLAGELMNMVNLSSELYKIETGSFILKPQTVPVSDLLTKLIKIFQETFSAKFLDLRLRHEQTGSNKIMAVGDPHLSFSLFSNLLKNACEAAPEDGKVIIDINEGEFIDVSIRNTGAVPAEIRDRFWDKFATCNKSQGTGIGTYSAKLLTEAQGGHVKMLTDDDKKTTTVKVSLPRKQ